MAKKGRPKGDLYNKYVTAFNRAKKSIKRAMIDPDMLNKDTFDAYAKGYSGVSDKEIIKEILDRQKYGRISKELKGRRDFYNSTLKKSDPDLKWNDIKYMSHAEFVEAYGDRISEIYTSYITSGYSVSDTKQLISQYIFGSE